ncbi:MAG: hypothetical protein QM733_15300 [Ilumatobacteraceae bacterium]
MAELGRFYVEAGDIHLGSETLLEAAGKHAWLGDVATARAVLDQAARLGDTTPSPLNDVLRLIASAALHVAAGDERAAASCLDPAAGASLSGPARWYWSDRAALALPYLLVPGEAARYDSDEAGPVHRAGVALAGALRSFRAGDSTALAALEWPAPGVARAFLPLRWLVELCAAGQVVGNPAPEELRMAHLTEIRAELLRLSETGTSRAATATSAARRRPTSCGRTTPTRATT